MKNKLVILISVLALLLLFGCSGTDVQISTEEYVLTTAIQSGGLVFLGVGGEINEIANPKLTAETNH